VIVEALRGSDTERGVLRAATLRWDGGEDRIEVEVEAALAGDPDDASPFVPLALLLAMRRQEDLVVDGLVSPRLLRGLTRARELYRAWSPPLHESRIEVAEERECARRSSAVGCLFSRGVDSTYSAAVPREYPGPIERLLFITGFEPAHDAEVAAEEARRARLAAEALGLPLSVVSASFLHAVVPAIGNLDDATTPMLALAALAVAGGLGTVVIPASDSTPELGPFGTSPVLDPLLSTEAVALEPDSVALSRVAKGLWLARERPDLLAQLKVCFNENRPDNCGRCAKCLLTMATLRAAGTLDAADQFPDEIDLEAIRARRVRVLQPRIDWAELARVLDDGRDPELRAAIVATLEHPDDPFPGPPPRADTPDFRARHHGLLVSVLRDRRPWPPPAPFAAPPGLGLVRAVDARAERHTYGVGRVPPGELAAELGTVVRDEAAGLEPLLVTAAGQLVTEAGAGATAPASLATRLRFVLAPLGWRDVALAARARVGAVARRAAWLVKGAPPAGSAAPPPGSAAPVAVVGYLHRHPSPGRLPLLSAHHPVTGDQLLATSEWEAIDMGYGPPALLGYLDEAAPLTGSLEPRRPPIPWASRFGQRVRP
jgi:hypothetical protein